MLLFSDDFGLLLLLFEPFLSIFPQLKSKYYLLSKKLLLGIEYPFKKICHPVRVKSQTIPTINRVQTKSGE